MDQTRLILLSFIVGLVAANSDVSSLFRQQCPKFRIKKSTIIRTQQSIHDGAEFLGKKVMSSSRDCHEQCCGKKGCNMVMLKYDVEKVSCFMFNCRSPSICTFYQHSSYHSYAALEYEDRKPSFISPQNSANKNHFKDEHKVEVTTTIEAPHTTKPPKVYKPDKANHWEHFNRFDATTTTKPEYKTKENYNSDFDDSTNSHISGKNWLNDQVKEQSTTGQSVYRTSGDSHVNPWQKSEANKNTKYQSQSTNYGSYDHTQNTNTDFPDKPTDVAAKTATEEEEFPRRVFVDNNPDFPEERKNPDAIPKMVKPKMDKPKALHPRTTSRVATKAPATRARVSNVVIRKISFQENKAVIPLAVGLVLALLLLLAIIFRLKTSRRRRTKAFLTDDADYLINGMYL